MSKSVALFLVVAMIIGVPVLFLWLARWARRTNQSLNALDSAALQEHARNAFESGNVGAGLKLLFAGNLPRPWAILGRTLATAVGLVVVALVVTIAVLFAG